jgi:hypothetical protein
VILELGDGEGVAWYVVKTVILALFFIYQCTNNADQFLIASGVICVSGVKDSSEISTRSEITRWILL